MSRIVVDPVTTDRRPSPHRGRSRRRRRQGRVVVLNDVPRHRVDPQGPRSARRVGVRAAHLWRVHDGARHHVDPRGRECDWRRAAAQRPVAAQSHHRRAMCSGSRRSFLPSARARLGGHRLGAVGRSRQDRLLGPVDLGLAVIECHVLRGSARSCQRVRRSWTAWPLRKCVLGSPGLQAAARSEPDGRCALPRGADWQREFIKMHAVLGGKNHICRAFSSAAWRHRSIRTARPHSTPARSPDSKSSLRKRAIL